MHFSINKPWEQLAKDHRGLFYVSYQIYNMTIMDSILFRDLHGLIPIFLPHIYLALIGSILLDLLAFNYCCSCFFSKKFICGNILQCQKLHDCTWTDQGAISYFKGSWPTITIYHSLTKRSKRMQHMNLQYYS